MVSLDDAVIARLKSHGETFELYVDPELALSYRAGDDVALKDVLAVESVFKDAGAGDKASEESLSKVFNSTDVNVVADKIIRKGELHLTTEQRRRMLEERRKQVVNIIACNAINPQTNTPHPAARIEAAMEEARVEVVLDKTAKGQVDKVLKALKPIIPIKFAKIKLAVKIPSQYTGKLYTVLREFGDVQKEEWRGSLQYCLIELPAGLQDELYNKINNLTHGEVETKVVD